MKTTSEIRTAFNFPRYLSETELSALPEIGGNTRYTLIQTTQKNQGKEINWTQILADGPYDVVIISDSFLGTDQGQYLCRKIAAENNVSVLHIFTNYLAFSDKNPFRTLVLLTNNGFLRKSGARVVILEDAERTLPGFVINYGDLNATAPMPVVASKKQGPVRNKSGSVSPGISTFLAAVNRSAADVDRFFQSNSNSVVTLKTWMINEILSVVGSRSNDGSLYFFDLNESRFTHNVYHSRLIFHQDDIGSFHTPTARYPDEYIEMNNKLNRISGKLGRQNISLIFIPAVSAYNTYYPYINDPPTARNQLFEILRVLNRSYVLVDTKAIVTKLQQDGEKDLSGIGDPAHWTWKVSDAVADQIDLDAKPGISPGTASGEYDRAVREFRSVMYERGDPRDAWAYRIDGQIYERSSDYRNATLQYQRSLDLNPRQPDVRARLLLLSGSSGTQSGT